MIKLSEFPNDTMLTVESNYCGDLYIMPKEDFLQSAYFLDYPVEPFPKVTVADKTVIKFDLWDWIEHLGWDDAHESWCEDVYNDLIDYPETKAFLERVKKVFENNPTYWEGQPVEIDMMRED